MNLALKIHGGILFGLVSDSDSIYDLWDYSVDLDANIPGYPYHELAIVDHSTVYCEGGAGGDAGGGDAGGGTGPDDGDGTTDPCAANDKLYGCPNCDTSVC